MKDLKLSGYTEKDIEKLTTVIVGGCLGSVVSVILSFFGFHIFMNEFVRTMVWQKTFLIWITLSTALTRIKGS